MNPTFDDCWAVRLDSQGRNSVLWDKTDHVWRLHVPGSYLPGPYDVAEVNTDQEAQARILVESFASRRVCGDCGVGVDGHLIAPDLFGAARLYCVQRPSESWLTEPDIDGVVVGSQGRKKHTNALSYTCADRQYLMDNDGDMIVRLDMAPATATEVLNRDWCSKCWTGDTREQALATTRALWVRIEEGLPR